jgi:hypothetical protein
LGTLLGSIGPVAVSGYSFETIELFREVSARLGQERETTRPRDGDPESAEISSYIVELPFNQLADEADRRFFNSVRTRLQLPSATLDLLKQLARLELRS